MDRYTVYFECYFLVFQKTVDRHMFFVGDYLFHIMILHPYVNDEVNSHFSHTDWLNIQTP